MIPDFLTFYTIPAGSLLTFPEGTEDKYLPIIRQLPESVKTLVISPRTGAYIRGLVKTYDVSLEKAPMVAFNVLKVCVGEQKVTQLSSVLSTDLKIIPDKASKIAQEIEKELFAPVALDLNMSSRQKITTPATPLPTPIQPTPPASTLAFAPPVAKPIAPTGLPKPASRILGSIPTGIKPAPHFPKSEPITKPPIAPPPAPSSTGLSNVVDLKNQTTAPKTPPPIPPSVPR